MIVTNSGKAGVNSNDQVTIDKVVFSDFSLSNISDYEQQQITAIQGTNTISANPTVALLSNGHALVQASVAANFNVNSVFILATGNNSEFLLAVTDSNGSLSEELNIDAIRRLTFNATANNLVMKSDVSSLVASAVSALPSASDDASSYAADAYNRANNYTNSYVDDKLNSNLNLDSTYANQAYSNATSYADSRLATKADVVQLSSYATSSNVDSIVDQVSSNTNYVQQQLANKPNTDEINNTNYNQGNLSSGADLNNITTPGTYWGNFFVPLHAPEEFTSDVYPRFKLTVTSPNAGIAHQTIYLMDGGGTQGLPTFYVRSTYAGDTWGDWQSIESNAYSSATSYTDSRLATKIDATELSNYATQSELSNYATSSALADYATNSSVDSLSNATNSQLASKVDASVLSAYVTTQVLTDASSQVDSALQTKANVTDLSSYATSSVVTALSSEVGTQLTSKADNVSLTSLATSLVNSANGSFNAIQSQFSNAPNDAVKDNHDGTISFNGINLSIRGTIAPNTDLFSINNPGVWKSNWGYQNTLINFPGPNGAATIIATGFSRNTNGLTLTVIDSWGNEYYTRWSNDHYLPWQEKLDTQDFNSFATLASSQIAILQSKADTDAGNIINNNRLINSLAAEVDSLKAKQ